MNPIYTALGTTIFEKMSGLARDLSAINLGHGFLMATVRQTLSKRRPMRYSTAQTSIRRWPVFRFYARQ